MTSDQFNLIEQYLSNYEFYQVCATIGILLNAGFSLYIAIFRD